MAFSKTQRRNRVKKGIRKKLFGTQEKPRVSIYKSNKAIYAQVIDDTKGQTLTFAHSFELGYKTNANLEVSKEVGKKLAEKATSNGISDIIFDRSGYKYHGKIKALAEGAREGGLRF